QDVRERLGKVEAVAMVALLAAIFFVPGVSAVLIGAAVGLTEAAGVPGIAIAAGFEAFRFWD
ncbi:MAG: site-2 protease family protein, partial [Phenylobacterium sp.]|nr:site-2 protease family protein [Phenylobacterium sp.]